MLATFTLTGLALARSLPDAAPAAASGRGKRIRPLAAPARSARPAVPARTSQLA